MWEQRYHATTQNWIHPDMSNVNKNIAMEAKLISPPTYFRISIRARTPGRNRRLDLLVDMRSDMTFRMDGRAGRLLFAIVLLLEIDLLRTILNGFLD